MTALPDVVVQLPPALRGRRLWVPLLSPLSRGPALLGKGAAAEPPWIRFPGSCRAGPWRRRLYQVLFFPHESQRPAPGRDAAQPTPQALNSVPTPDTLDCSCVRSPLSGPSSRAQEWRIYSICFCSSRLGPRPLTQAPSPGCERLKLGWCVVPPWGPLGARTRSGIRWGRVSFSAALSH